MVDDRLFARILRQDREDEREKRRLIREAERARAADRFQGTEALLGRGGAVPVAPRPNAACSLTPVSRSPLNHLQTRDRGLTRDECQRPVRRWTALR